MMWKSMPKGGAQRITMFAHRRRAAVWCIRHADLDPLLALEWLTDPMVEELRRRRSEEEPHGVRGGPDLEGAIGPVDRSRVRSGLSHLPEQEAA
jgi:hypothetical protein